VSGPSLPRWLFSFVLVGTLACGTEAPTPRPAKPIVAEEAIQPTSQIKFDVGSMPSTTPLADPTMAEELRAGLADAEEAGVPLASFETVRRFYEQRQHRPAWTVARQISAAGVDALRALGQLPRHGLDPAHYGADALAPRGPQPDDAVAFELRLTDAWLTAAVHLGQGRVRPDLAPAWSADGRADDLVPRLEQAITEGNPRQALLEHAPPHPEYAARVDALASLRPRAKRTTADPATGPAADPTAALVEQLSADLERWRWLPRELGPHHVRIDPGALTIQAYEDGKVAVTTKAALSRRCAAIHGLSTTLSRVEFHPAERALGAIDLSSAAGDLVIHGAPPDEPLPETGVLRRGCVRSEPLLPLVKAVLRPSSTWSDQALAAAMASETPAAEIDPPIPVYVIRTTVDLEGSTPTLRPDAAAQNAALLRALQRAAPKRRDTRPTSPKERPAPSAR